MLLRPINRYLHTEAAGGIVLVLATVAALAWANSPWASAYDGLWATDAGIRIGSFSLEHDLRHWVNDLAMAVFFFVAGLEIKRELVHGELRTPRSASLPIAAALGGMVVPAILYAVVTRGTDAAGGWGIPMATDIAFALGVLALAGRRAPASLKVFLLTLAIVDDLGAILVIAFFYSTGFQASWLLLAVAGTVAVVLMQRQHVRSVVPYCVLAAMIWLGVLESGVHATVAGVVLGLLTPARPFHHPRDARDAARAELDEAALGDDVADEEDEVRLAAVSAIAREAISPLARLERVLHPWSAFVILPLFALANAGLKLSADQITSAATDPAVLGVVVGLTLGKPAGILLAALVAVRVFGAELPRGTTWLHVIGVATLAGIGFTVSIFISGLAFEADLEARAKLGVLGASILAGGAGAVILRAARPRP